MKNKLKRIMLITLTLIFSLSLIIFFFAHQPKFGKLPSGERLEKIKLSSHFIDGSFRNLSKTSVMTEGVSYQKMFRDFFFSKNKKPLNTIPSVKTDLLNLDRSENVLVWFGHSSYFMQIDGKRILVDPVLSGSASPLAFTAKAFDGTDAYSTDDIPEIDYLFISHDHWDHLDYETVIKLKSKIKKIVCGLGVGAHFEHWGFDKNNIIERDWNDTIILDEGFTAHTTPARHFSGRGFRANKSLWTSFVLQTPTTKIFIGGDSGYDTHFAETGKTFRGFDLAILENGQYDSSWKYIHMIPEQVLQAAKDLNAKSLFPVHSSKFALGNHAWDGPLNRISEANKEVNLRLLTPIIGEILNLKDSTQKFSQWWKTVKKTK